MPPFRVGFRTNDPSISTTGSRPIPSPQPSPRPERAGRPPRIACNTAVSTSQLKKARIISQCVRIVFGGRPAASVDGSTPGTSSWIKAWGNPGPQDRRPPPSPLSPVPSRSRRGASSPGTEAHHGAPLHLGLLPVLEPLVATHTAHSDARGDLLAQIRIVGREKMGQPPARPCTPRLLLGLVQAVGGLAAFEADSQPPPTPRTLVDAPSVVRRPVDASGSPCKAAPSIVYRTR